MKKITFSFLFILAFQIASGTTWNVGTSGFAFSPVNTTIVLGDNVSFVMGNSHDAVEVSMATYNANGTTPLSGGFSIPISGSGVVTSSKLTLGTHYFICTPHVASNNMKGTIVVMNSGCTVPSKPPSIAGNTPVCPSSVNSYSVSAVTDATSYTWTLPNGWTGSSTTNSINTTAGASGGTISVTANNTCGSSTATILAVAISSGPAQPGTISGNTSICFNSSNSYSISAVQGATSYTWTLPAGWSGSSTSTSITANAGSGSGTISVTSNNACTSSVARTLNVVNSGPPNQPGVITGNSPVCPNSSNIYNIDVVPGATTYTWTLPSGWSGSSSSNSISVMSGALGGNISVVANSTCGTSISRVLAVTTASSPAQPGTITGNVAVCANSANTYSAISVPGATSYTWTLPVGWSGSSSTNTINATAGANAGTISVTANSSCGSSLARTLSVNTSGTIGQPGAITGNTSVCNNTSVMYTIAPISGASSYTWNLPLGWTGTSTTNSITAMTGATGGTVSVFANSTCGNSSTQTLTVAIATTISQPSTITGKSSVCASSSNEYSVPAINGATSYAWTLPIGWTGTSSTNTIIALAGSSGGNITVSANNGCGSSPVQTIATTVLPFPAQPAAISGNSITCPNSVNDYEVEAVPGAQFYAWVMPPGWTINSTSNFITTLVNNTGGTITVAANNSCGSSPKQSLNVQINLTNKIVTQSGSTLTAAATGAAYQWINCATKMPIAGQTNQSFVASAIGSYAVIIKQNNCTDTSSCIAFSTVPNEEILYNPKIIIYPNPSRGKINIEMDRIENARIEIWNPLGEKIYKTSITSLKSEMDLSNEVKGIYFISIYLKNLVLTKKVVLQ
ncbi:MAG: T9SS type A sorting domain-containing protein [Saprospiraceae bacterium]